MKVSVKVFVLNASLSTLASRDRLASEIGAKVHFPAETLISE